MSSSWICLMFFVVFSPGDQAIVQILANDLFERAKRSIILSQFPGNRTTVVESDHRVLGTRLQQKCPNLLPNKDNRHAGRMRGIGSRRKLHRVLHEYERSSR